MHNFKTVVIGVALVFLSGCKSTQSLYSEFDEYVVGKPDIDVIIDALIFDDLRGKAIGVDVTTNAGHQDQARKSATKYLSELGYRPNIAFVGGGVFFTPEEGKDYFYSTDLESTGERYVPVANAEDGFKSRVARAFFNELIKQAEADRASRKSKKSVDIHVQPIPATAEFLQSLDSDIVMYISIEGTSVDSQKSLGINIASMAVTGLLTGGVLLVVPLTNMHRLNIIAVDRMSGKILWSNEPSTRGDLDIDRSIKQSMSFLPLASGRYLSYKEKKAKRGSKGVKAL